MKEIKITPGPELVRGLEVDSDRLKKIRAEVGLIAKERFVQQQARFRRSVSPRFYEPLT